MPELVGGSADLAPSTLTLIDGGGSVEAGDVRGPQPALRHPRARHGRDRQRPHAERLPRLRGRLPHLQRLHEGRHPAGRDHAHPVHLRVHPRLDRGGRGRADAPADRAARHPARDAEPRRRAPRRASTRRRWRGGTRCARRTARRCSPSPARACPCGTRRACPTTRSSAAPTCCTTRRAGPAGGADGDRLGGPHRQRRGQAARSRRHPGTARVDAVPRPLRRAGRSTTATACCRRPSAPGWRSRRRARSAGTAGSGTRATSSRWRASAPRRPPRSCTSTSGSRARPWPRGPAWFSRGARHS